MSDQASDQDLPLTGASLTQILNGRRLMGTRCMGCGALYLPPRPLCPHCYQGHMEWIELSGRGRLCAFTVIHVAPTAMIDAGYSRDNPYCSGVVQLDEGPGISAQILGIDVAHPEAIAIGQPVQATFVERGEGEARQVYLAFEPAEKA